MHPILFQTKHVTLYTFWLFFAIALIATTYMLIKLATKRGLKIQFLADHSIGIIFWTFLGARIGGIIQDYNTYFYEFSQDAIIKIFYIWDKGVSLWGSVIAFGIYFFIISRKNKQDFLKWLDVLVPAAILAYAICSVGAFFDGINYGRETILPWGVNFESPSIKYTVPIHPTQIYAFLYSTFISISLIYIGQSQKVRNYHKSGIVGMIGIITFGIFKFMEEFLRGDDTWLLFGQRLPLITTPLVVLLTTGLFIYMLYNKPKNKI